MRAESPTGGQLLRFLVERAGVRGVFVRLDAAWEAIRSRQPYPAAVESLLGEAAAASALFTAHAKLEGRLSVQLRGTGALRTLFAECTSAGTLRGIARHEGEVEARPDSLRLAGDGAVLAITIESQPPGAGEPVRYQGLVGLDADRLAEAFEGYFRDSEQLPTRLLLASRGGVAAGLMLQQLPGGHGDEDGWPRCSALFDTLGEDELLALDAETLLWRLFHEEGIRLLDDQPLGFACGCSQARVEGMLVGLGREEALAAAEEAAAEITCEFCGQVYRLDRVEIEQLFRTSPPTPPPPGLH